MSNYFPLHVPVHWKGAHSSSSGIAAFLPLNSILSLCAPGGTVHPIRLLIADDHATFRQGLCMLFDIEPDIEVVGEAIDGRDAVVQARDLQPDVILMDMRMPGID